MIASRDASLLETSDMSTVHVFAEKYPNKPAVVFSDGSKSITYAELEARSRRLGNLLRRLGCEPGDGVVLLMANEEWFYDVFWAAMRTGLYFTPVNWHLQQGEVRYIVENCDAKVLITSARFAEVAEAVSKDIPRLKSRLVFGGDVTGFTRAETALRDVPADAPLEDAREGAMMLYSSGTTGYPKACASRSRCACR